LSSQKRPAHQSTLTSSTVSAEARSFFLRPWDLTIQGLSCQAVSWPLRPREGKASSLLPEALQPHLPVKLPPGPSGNLLGEGPQSPLISPAPPANARGRPGRSNGAALPGAPARSYRCRFKPTARRNPGPTQLSPPLAHRRACNKIISFFLLFACVSHSTPPEKNTRNQSALCTHTMTVVIRYTGLQCTLHWIVAPPLPPFQCCQRVRSMSPSRSGCFFLGGSVPPGSLNPPNIEMGEAGGASAGTLHSEHQLTAPPHTYTGWR